MRMTTDVMCGLLLSMAAGVGQAQAPAPLVYATLQKPGAPTGYVTSSWKAGLESAAGFFTVSGDILRMGNVDFRITENAAAPKNNMTYSLKDSSGRFLICCDNAAATVSATPAANEQWFRITRYTSAQKTEFENRVRALHNRASEPRHEADVN